MLPSNLDILALLAFAALYIYLGRKLWSTRDFLLVTSAAGSIGFMMAGIFHRWALIVGLILLIAESFYLAVIFKPRVDGWLVAIFQSFWKIQAQTAFVMGVALFIFVVFATEQSRRNVQALSGYIDIYEPHASVEWVPRVSNDIIGDWILKTDDPASSVLDYYRDIAARDGWQISSLAPPTFAAMRKNGLKITFMAQEDEKKGTTVIITLSNVED